MSDKPLEVTVRVGAGEWAATAAYRMITLADLANVVVRAEFGGIEIKASPGSEIDDVLAPLFRRIG